MAVTASQVKELREKTGVGMMECKKALTENDGDIDKAILWLRERGLSRAAKKAGRVAAEGMVAVAVSADQKTGIALEVNCETDFVSKNIDFQNFSKEIAKLALDNKITNVSELSELSVEGTKVSSKITEMISTIGENIKLRRVKVVEAPNGVVSGYSHMGGKIGSLVAIDGKTGQEIEELGADLAMHTAAAAPRYLNSKAVDPSELESEKALARKKLEEEGKPADLIEKILLGQMNKFYKEVCLIDQVFVKDSSYTVSKLLKEKAKGANLVDYCRFQLGEGIEKKQEDFAAEVAAARQN